MLNKLTGGGGFVDFVSVSKIRCFHDDCSLIRLVFWYNFNSMILYSMILYSMILYSMILYFMNHSKMCVCIYDLCARVFVCVCGFVLRFVLKLPGEIERNNHNCRSRIFCVEKRINSTLVDSFIVILSYLTLLFFFEIVYRIISKNDDEFYDFQNEYILLLWN